LVLKNLVPISKREGNTYLLLEGVRRLVIGPGHQNRGPWEKPGWHFGDLSLNYFTYWLRIKRFQGWLDGS